MNKLKKESEKLKALVIGEKINVPLAIGIKSNDVNAAAQIELEKTYCKVDFVENNFNNTFRWILLSAEQGDMESQLKLGNLYALGCDTEKKFSESFHWYTKAALQGYKKALVRIHNLYQEDIRMHCRGQLNSEEDKWASNEFKKKNNIRELYEYRVEQNRSILNGAIDYYTSKFNHYRSSDLEDQYVQLNLAFLYQHGYGVKKCVRWAFEYYELAANQGNTEAQYNLGYLYQKHADKKFNYRHAFTWYTKSAQGGNVAAQRCLAYFYLKGLATDIDYETAIIWYTKAANAGDSEAQVILGKLYRKGDYIKQNLSIAVKWYSLAARQGSRVAQNCLAQLYRRGMLTNIKIEDDISEYYTDRSMEKRLCSKLSMDISKLDDPSDFKQLNELVKRACIGDGLAMYEVGLNYYNGDHGFNQDKDIGIQWLKHAANAKHKAAQFMLADLYKRGDSIDQDYHKTVIWYKKIAQKKDSKAQCFVGDMYNEGLGVRKDPLEASKWFIWAADQGNDTAQYNLGILRCQGRGIRKDEKEAIKWLYKSVRQKNIQACYQLGDFYFYGHAGLEKNKKNALILIEFAAKKGHVGAQMFLGYIFTNGITVQKDIKKSIQYYTMASGLGNAEAPYRLALIYLKGNGTDYDYIKAYDMFKQAKHRGYEYAKYLFQIPIGYDLSIADYSIVLDMFTEITEKGKDSLSYHIGCLYWYGVKQDHGDQVFQENYTKAKEWFLNASKRGDPRADFHLGIMYESGKGIEKNLTTGVYYYHKAIENENSNAMYRLACMYLNGYGMTQDLLQAFHLYKRASTMGHKKATEALAVFQKQNEVIFYLDSTPKDPKIAIDRKSQIRMLEKATREGYIRLQYQLGIMYEQNNNNSKAFTWFKLATDLGVTDAYYMTGIHYEEGRGVAQDYSMAATMYQKAIEKEHVDAYYRLGRLYQYENGVELDYLKAYDLYKKAAEMGHVMASKSLNITLETKDSLTMYKYVAEHGNTEAQFKVGFAYDHDYSGSNYAEAFKWYSMAASNSHREAMYQLGLLYEHGLGVSQDYYEAIQLYNQAYQLGSDDALFRLAIVYHYGKGVDIDQEKAMKYYITSAELGNPEYQFELGRLYEEGELMQANLLMALKWYTIAYAQGYDKIIPKLLAMYVDNKPYEEFFFEKLFQNLSIASCNHFSLNEEYGYASFSKINNRLGTLYCFGLGTNRNLEKALEYFSKEYSDAKNKLISNFSFLRNDDFSAGLKNEILNEIETNEELINKLEPDKLYSLGMIYYDGIVQTENIKPKNNKKGYTPIDERNPNDSSQYIVIEKNHLKAFRYMKKAADKQYYKAMMEPVLFHYNSDINKDNIQGEQYHAATSNGNTDSLESIATFHLEQDFSKAVEWCSYIEKTLIEDKEISEKERKNVNIQVHLGWGYLYEYGYGMKQDYGKAIEYYKKLVDNNHPMGYFRLALMYYYGKGVQVDYEEAFEQFKQIGDSELNHDEILFMYDQNDLHISDSLKKMMYCTKTLYEVYGESGYYLGLMYKQGKGVPKDDDMAQLCFNGASYLDCERAKDEIK